MKVMFSFVFVGSPYLTSLNVNHRRAAVGAWRLPRASLGDTRLDTPGETGPARLTSLSNGLGRCHEGTTSSVNGAYINTFTVNGFVCLLEMKRFMEGCTAKTRR